MHPQQQILWSSQAADRTFYRLWRCLNTWREATGRQLMKICLWCEWTTREQFSSHQGFFNYTLTRESVLLQAFFVRDFQRNAMDQQKTRSAAKGEATREHNTCYVNAVHLKRLSTVSTSSARWKAKTLMHCTKTQCKGAQTARSRTATAALLPARCRKWGRPRRRSPKTKRLKQFATSTGSTVEDECWGKLFHQGAPTGLQLYTSS